MAADHKLALVLGSSGSGKTTLVRLLLRQSKYKTTYLVNCKDRSGYKNLGHKIRELDWDACLEQRLKKCNIVFEDLITLQQKKQSVIKNIVHFLLRRKYINMFLVSHEIRNSGLFSLLEHADTVYTTSGFRNAKVLRDFIRIRPIKGLDVETFLGKKFHYLKTSMDDRSFQVLDSNLEDSTDSLGMSLASKRKAVETALKCFPEPGPMLVTFDLIFKNVDPDALTANDLCLLTKDKGHPVKISIVDFLSSLRSREKPSRELRRLKQSLDKLFVIPDVFVANPYMKTKNREPK